MRLTWASDGEFWSSWTFSWKSLKTPTTSATLLHLPLHLHPSNNQPRRRMPSDHRWQRQPLDWTLMSPPRMPTPGSPCCNRRLFAFPVRWASAGILMAIPHCSTTGWKWGSDIGRRMVLLEAACACDLRFQRSIFSLQSVEFVSVASSFDDFESSWIELGIN